MFDTNIAESCPQNYSIFIFPSFIIQLNKNTHYIDSSNVYGSDPELANKLRLFNGGQLMYNTIEKQNYCPLDFTKTLQKGNQTEATFAFLAGNRQFYNTIYL